MNDLLAKIIELGAAIGELKARAAVSEVKAEGAEERAKLLLEAKNLWQDRALAAEKTLDDARKQGWKIT